MFIEINSHNRKSGWLEVVCGSMFSGKTEELIRRIRRAQIANQRVMIFKPIIDNRYSKTEIVSHDRNSIISTPVENAMLILDMVDNAEVVGIDEAQFFDKGLVGVVRTLANQGLRVIVAGLDMDYTGKPFGVMPDLLAQAEFITKVHAICQVCGSLANFSYRLNKDISDQVLVGEKSSYEPRCRRCFNMGEEAVSPSKETLNQQQTR
ncbi:MAG: thymidine kinase [Bacteroidota bacterium]